MRASGDAAGVATTTVDLALVKALARACRWRRLLEKGRYGSIHELSGAESINGSYVSRLLRLTLLAPDVVEAILDACQPKELTLHGLLARFPSEWDRQQFVPLPRHWLLSAERCQACFREPSQRWTREESAIKMRLPQRTQIVGYLEAAGERAAPWAGPPFRAIFALSIRRRVE